MKDDVVVIAQPTPEGPVAPVVPSVVDPFAEGGQSVMNPTALDVPSSLFFNF